MQQLTIYCEDNDFSDLAAAFGGEVAADCPLSAEIIFIDAEGIRRLNSRTRGIDAVTDVLSYPAFENYPHKPICAAEHATDTDEFGCVFIGSVAICVARAREQAQEYGHSFGRELNYLAAHGICHLLGYDHIREEDKPAMRALEERVLAKLDLKRSDT